MISIEGKIQGGLVGGTESLLRPKLDYNHKLSLKEFPYIIRWRDDRCKRCGSCTAVCPVKAIEPTVKVQRIVQLSSFYWEIHNAGGCRLFRRRI